MKNFLKKNIITISGALFDSITGFLYRKNVVVFQAPVTCNQIPTVWHCMDPLSVVWHSIFFNQKPKNNSMKIKIKSGTIVLALSISYHAMAQESGKLFFTTYTFVLWHLDFYYLKTLRQVCPIPPEVPVTTITLSFNEKPICKFKLFNFNK